MVIVAVRSPILTYYGLASLLTGHDSQTSRFRFLTSGPVIVASGDWHIGVEQQLIQLVLLNLIRNASLTLAGGPISLLDSAPKTRPPCRP